MSAVCRRHLVGKTPRNFRYYDTAYTLLWQVSDYVDIFKPNQFRLYSNNTINLRPIISYIMSCYTHKTILITPAITKLRKM